jgi:hypothetical protein
MKYQWPIWPFPWENASKILLFYYFHLGGPFECQIHLSIYDIILLIKKIFEGKILYCGSHPCPCFSSGRYPWLYVSKLLDLLILQTSARWWFYMLLRSMRPIYNFIHVNFLSWQNWRFEVFQLKFWSKNWRFFVDILCVHRFIIKVHFLLFVCFLSVFIDYHYIKVYID